MSTIYYNEHATPPISGITNTSNICWCNSLLQSVFSLPSINHTLLLKSDNLNSFAYEYLKLFSAAFERSYEMAGQTINELLKPELKNAGGPANEGQCCANEALMIFVKLLNCKKIDALLSQQTQTISLCPSCHAEKTVTDLSSFLLIKDRAFHSLDDFMKLFAGFYSGPLDLQCEKCPSTLVQFCKTTSTAEIITIVFHNFKQHGQSYFPLLFELADGSKYKLVAKIEHFGTDRNSGHYVAHVLRRGVIHLANDSHVGPGNFDPSPQTFMLFYHICR